MYVYGHPQTKSNMYVFKKILTKTCMFLQQYLYYTHYIHVRMCMPYKDTHTHLVGAFNPSEKY